MARFKSNWQTKAARQATRSIIKALDYGDTYVYELLLTHSETGPCVCYWPANAKL